MMESDAITTEPLTPREAAELLIFMTRAIGFAVEVKRGAQSVWVQARKDDIEITTTNADGADDECLHTAVAQMAEQVAATLDV